MVDFKNIILEDETFFTAIHTSIFFIYDCTISWVVEGLDGIFKATILYQEGDNLHCKIIEE